MMLDSIPTIRELLDAAPEKHGDRTFIKYIRDGQIVEKRFSEVRSDSLAFCRKLRDLLPDKTHVAIVSKSCYEYIVCMTGVIISGNVAIPVAPDAPVEELAAILNDADVTASRFQYVQPQINSDRYDADYLEELVSVPSLDEED